MKHVVALLLAVLTPPAAAQPSSPKPTATLAEGVSGGGHDAAGALWFSSWTQGISFSLPALPNDEDARIFAALSEAAQAGRTIVVRFDPGSGRYDTDAHRISYRVCALQFEQSRFGADPVFCDGAPGASAGPAEKALAEGVAQSASGADTAAIGSLDTALASGDLDKWQRIIGLRARHASIASLVYTMPPGVDRDARLVKALADARAWAVLASDDHDAPLAAAADLTDLGAYEEAIGAYRTVAERWPDERYRSAVRIGAIHRTLGDYRRALSALDDLVARDGAQTGMKFHYHRGWTLGLLGRHADAVVEFTAGLADQPDYYWALIRRACSLGQLGRITEAARDQRAAVAIINVLSAARPPSAPIVQQEARAKEVNALLEVAAAQGNAQPTDIACTGYAADEVKRKRSGLLPSAS